MCSFNKESSEHQKLQAELDKGNEAIKEFERRDVRFQEELKQLKQKLQKLADKQTKDQRKSEVKILAAGIPDGDWDIGAQRALLHKCLICGCLACHQHCCGHAQVLEQEAEQLQKQLPIMQQEIDQLSEEATRKEEVSFNLYPSGPCTCHPHLSKHCSARICIFALQGDFRLIHHNISKRSSPVGPGGCRFELQLGVQPSNTRKSVAAEGTTSTMPAGTQWCRKILPFSDPTADSLTGNMKVRCDGIAETRISLTRRAPLLSFM